eukprot:6203885-Pleurochrysis_carterae.AAC.3
MVLSSSGIVNNTIGSGTSAVRRVYGCWGLLHGSNAMNGPDRGEPSMRDLPMMSAEALSVNSDIPKRSPAREESKAGMCRPKRCWRVTHISEDVMRMHEG